MMGTTTWSAENTKSKHDSIMFELVQMGNLPIPVEFERMHEDQLCFGSATALPTERWDYAK